MRETSVQERISDEEEEEYEQVTHGVSSHWLIGKQRPIYAPET